MSRGLGDVYKRQLYYYEEYTIKEIAEILGKKQNTVNSKLVRGRNRLKKLMEVKHG